MLTYLLVKQSVNFDPMGMFVNILQVVILPIILGLVIKAIIKEKADIISEYTPAVSTMSIALIVAGVISVNGDKILSSLGVILIVVILHNVLGYALGFILGNIMNLGRKKSITLAVEVGMQNSGLAASLAASQFASMPMAAVPAALFSAWHNISGAIFAWGAKTLDNKRMEKEMIK